MSQLLADEVAYVVGLEKFVVRRDGRWRVDQPLTATGLRFFLKSRGWPPDQVRALLDGANHLIVVGFDCRPGQPPVWADAADDLHLNLYVPPAIVPTPGSHPRIDRILRELANGDPEAVAYITNWLAYKHARPDALPQTSLVLHGAMGSGKGTLWYVLSQIFGPHNVAHIKQSALLGNFNQHWGDRLIIFADEIVTRDSPEVASTLRHIVGATTIEINPKGQPQRLVPNRAGLIIASNFDPIQLAADDRRFSVFYRPEGTLDPEYKRLLLGCFNDTEATPDFAREIAAWAHTLQTWNVDVARAKTVYDNSDRRRLIMHSRDSFDAFAAHLESEGIDGLLHTIKTEHLYVSHWGPLDPALTYGPDHTIEATAVYRAYLLHCRQSANTHPLKRERFMSRLQERFAQSRPRRAGKRPYCYAVPRAPTPDDGTTGPDADRTERAAVVGVA